MKPRLLAALFLLLSTANTLGSGGTPQAAWLKLDYSLNPNLLVFTANDDLGEVLHVNKVVGFNSLNNPGHTDFVVAASATDREKTWKLDDLRAVVTPEPLGLMLFGLGGLPIAVRMLRRTEKQEA